MNKANGINSTPRVAPSPPREEIQMDPILIVAIDRCEEPQKNCFCAHNWTEAPTLDAVSRGRSVLRDAHRGPAVAELQRLLNAHHPEGEPLEVDGYFGPRTEARVRSFQRKHGLPVDGVAGVQTIGALADLVERDLLIDDRFSSLSDEVQRSAINRIERTSRQADRRAIALLVTSESFAALRPAQQQLVLTATDVASMQETAAYASFMADARRSID